MNEIVVDQAMVAYCGLYCGACGRYVRGKCTGCAKNEKATWCSIRKCCAEHGWTSCAGCTLFADARECGKFNNLMSKVFGLMFRSNRAACIERIKKAGRERFAAEMAGMKRHSLK